MGQGPWVMNSPSEEQPGVFGKSLYSQGASGPNPVPQLQFAASGRPHSGLFPVLGLPGTPLSGTMLHCGQLHRPHGRVQGGVVLPQGGGSPQVYGVPLRSH